MKADERTSDVLEYEPRSGILYRMKTPDQWSGQTIQHAVTVV